MDTCHDDEYDPYVKKRRALPPKDYFSFLTVTKRTKKRSLEELAPLKGEKNFHLPRDYWQEGCLFFGFSDEGWQERTGGVFPATLKSTHPLYVWKTDQTGETVCPCTSRKNNDAGMIPEGSVLEFTGHVTEKTSYVLHALRFPVAPEESLNEKLDFKGVFPPENLRKPQ